MGPLSGPGTGGRAAFRYPNFRYYMTARMLATIASEMQAVAVGWQIYALTHRALDLGLVGLAQFLPGILLVLNGVVRSFNGPAAQAFLPLVVPEEVFPSAVALGSGVFQGAMVVGPMV